jgi:L-glutamine-phosphate cytidylyltransferase
LASFFIAPCGAAKGPDHRIMTHQGIILAAGQGRRLLPYTSNLPKCLLDIGGQTILEHQVEALFSLGVAQVAVVVGYLGDKVRKVLGGRVCYIENSRFADTSSMYSLWLARELVEQGFLVLNSDVLFHVDILRRLLQTPHPDALAVDFHSILEEEEMKVRVRNGRVRALGKELRNGDAENLGIAKFSAAGSRVLFAKIRELLDQNLWNVMVPYAVNAIAQEYPLTAVPVRDLPWIEIDFPEDYLRAREVIYPAITKPAESGVGTQPAAAGGLPPRS